MRVLHLNNYDKKGGAESVFCTTSQITSLQNTLGFVPADHRSERPHVPFKSWESDNILFGLVNYVFSYHNYKVLYDYLSQTDIDVIHLHGFFSSLSPSILLAIRKVTRKKRIKVIQTLHDFHLVCPNSSLYNFSTNYICEKCVGKKYKLSIIKDHCDRRGYLYSLVKGIRSFVSDNILKHREVIDTFICPSDFLRSKLLEDGVDSQRIKMIRNPISIYSPLKASSKKNIICYFGRFSREKNLEFLLDTFAEWKTRAKNDFRLLLIGGGEEEKALKERAARSPIASSISFKEYMPYEQLVDQLADVKYLSLTSLCFENSPMTVLESISMNIIPLVPNIGGMNESVESFTHIGKTFQINSKESWIQAIECLEKNYTTEMDNLIRRKKAIFEETGTSAYYKKLYDVYGAP